jgi:glycosyltransferase involved in cell wall biosynthesis
METIEAIGGAAARSGSVDGSDLRVLVLHGRYRSAGPSGENEVVDDEVLLLREYGCNVRQLELQSDDIAGWSKVKKATLPGRVVWSRAGQKALRDAIADYRPDVVHIHNTFPQFSPAIFWTARRSGVGIVHTLHNFRPLCPAATFLREGKACETCLGHVPFAAVRHACYRDSRLATLPLATMSAVHDRLGTWQRCVDRFITLSEFERAKYVEAGWPAEKFRMKFNTVWEPAVPERLPGNAFLCMSRLVPEKGVDVLLEGWKRAFPDGNPPLHLTASGDSGAELMERYGRLPGVTFLGHVSRDELMAELSAARAVVVPSRCYEGFPRVIVEAYAARVPIVASRVGSLVELVRDGETGLHVEMGDPDDMARALRRLADDPESAVRMGEEARETYERLYSPESTMAGLLDIYREAVACARQRTGAGPTAREGA